MAPNVKNFKIDWTKREFDWRLFQREKKDPKKDPKHTEKSKDVFITEKERLNFDYNKQLHVCCIVSL